MILNFSIENWMSFRNPVSFSMIASRERQHGDRISKINKYKTRLLPISAIYGGNASGKTNLFKALNFARDLIVKGTQPDSLIPIKPFSLDDNLKKNPSRFVFELLIENTIFEFSFTVNQKAVIEEKLVHISSTSEKVMYHRLNNEPNFEKSLKKNKFLDFAFKGTRDNQLFLTNSVSQKIDIFRPIYDWFKNSLKFVAPDTRFASFEQFIDEDHPLYSTLNDMLILLDTGIIHLGGENISFENISFPEFLKTIIQEEVKEGKTIRIVSETANDRFIISRKKGELICKKLVAFHHKTDGTKTKFDIKNESDGSQRIIDLLPAFLELSATNSNSVFIIDELDRSLHTLLTKQLLEIYLDNCSEKSRSQLIFTTHDAFLMDQNIFRRDEMWVTERNHSGISNLISFSEYKDVRYDKDIRKSYLKGHLGGIPRIIAKETLPTCIT